MSTTDGRRERMQRILKLYHEDAAKNGIGLTINEIALKTEVLTEITMDRLHKYHAELEWCGMLIRHGQRYSLLPGVSIKNERERRSKRERKKP